MYEKLETLLSKWTNPTRKAIIMDAFRVLEIYQTSAAIETVNLRLEEYASYTTDENLDAIDSCLRDALGSVFASMNLNIQGEVAELAHLARAFNTLVEYSDHDSITNRIDLGGDPFDIIYDLLEIVDVEASLLWMQLITPYVLIPDGLLLRLREIHALAVANESAEIVPPSPAMDTRFHRIRSFLGAFPESLAKTLIVDEAMLPNLPLSTLVSLTRERFLLMDVAQPHVLATSLLGLVLISDTAEDRIVGVAKDLVDDIWIDNAVIDTVLGAINSVTDSNVWRGF